MGLIQKFKDMFFKPDVDDHYIIDKWKKETEEADRRKELHRQARKQDKRGLTVEDFEKARQKKKKNKTLSSNF
tara:strand:+ start:210 stop:428 length:219 start_codon:yes stop_codon:yes gene_type:complete